VLRARSCAAERDEPDGSNSGRIGESGEPDESDFGRFGGHGGCGFARAARPPGKVAQRSQDQGDDRFGRRQSGSSPIRCVRVQGNAAQPPLPARSVNPTTSVEGRPATRGILKALAPDGAQGLQAVCPVECCLPNPEIVESEEVLIARALKLHPDDDELKKKAAANNYPSRFRK
jgi:hypothetical protein